MELTDIDGVGPARSDSLVDAGYDSVEMLAMSDADEVAEDVEIPEDTALEFVVQAQNMVADESADESDEEASEADAEDSEDGDDPMPADLAEPTESDDTDEEEDADASDEIEDEVEEEEVYSLTVDLESDIHYDAYMTALLNAYELRSGSNQNALDAISHALDDARYNDGSVTHELTEYELNTLHAAVSQQSNEYKGNNMIDHMDAMRDLLSQVNEVRQAELF